MENDKYKLIFSQKLCGWLMMHNFPLREMRKDEYGSDRNIYIFNNSRNLQSEINEYTKYKQIQK